MRILLSVSGTKIDRPVTKGLFQVLKTPNIYSSRSTIIVPFRDVTFCTFACVSNQNVPTDVLSFKKISCDNTEHPQPIRDRENSLVLLLARDLRALKLITNSLRT